MTIASVVMPHYHTMKSAIAVNHATTQESVTGQARWVNAALTVSTVMELRRETTNDDAKEETRTRARLLAD